jgi:aminopeptidase N
MLRRDVGDSMFRNIIRQYYQQFKGSNAETRDFVQVAERVAGRSFTIFSQQWLYAGGVPNLNAKWVAKSDQQIELNVQQQSKVIYELPLEVAIIYKDGKQEIQVIKLSKAAESFLINVKEKPAKLTLDPHVNLLFEGKISAQ